MEQEQRRKQSFLLRLPVSLREQATQIAREEGTSLNHFISLAVAEKISRLSPSSSHPKPSTPPLPERQHDFRGIRFPRMTGRVA
jgi:hypothetical protein